MVKKEYIRWLQRFSNYKKALRKLEEAIDLYKKKRTLWFRNPRFYKGFWVYLWIRLKCDEGLFKISRENRDLWFKESY